MHPSEIVEAARDQVGQALQRHPIAVSVVTDALVRLDPRLTAAALAQLLENAAQYAPAESAIDVGVSVSAEGSRSACGTAAPASRRRTRRICSSASIRGTASRGRATGTGMGLSIARGLLAAEQGRVWAENCRRRRRAVYDCSAGRHEVSRPDAETA